VVLAVAIVGAAVAVGVCAVALAAGLTARHRVEGASDLAALVAADAASGAIAGEPCQLAERVAQAGGARLSACTPDGLIVRVTVVGTFGGIPIEAHSAAGPPR
jgi:secretion/DNA translocation related TadE-like protein